MELYPLNYSVNEVKEFGKLNTDVDCVFENARP